MELTIQAQSRKVLGRHNNKLRSTGVLPAVLYGPGKETLTLQVGAKDFERVYKQAGENTLVNLAIDGGSQKKVLIHEVAKHFMKNEPVHVDFYEVDLSKKIHAKIPLEFTGVSAAVKNLSGVLVKNLTEIEVEAMPADLPHNIEVSIEGLATFEDAVRVSDIKVSDKVKIISHGEEVIVSVQAPRTEEELKALEGSAAEAEKATIEAMNKEAEEAKAAAGAEEGEKGEAKEDKKEAKAEK